MMQYLTYYQNYNTQDMNHLPKIPHDETANISSDGLSHILNNFDASCPQRNFLWTADYKVELPVRVKKSGPGSEVPYTIPEMWQQTVQKYADHNALNFEVSPNKWVTWTYRKYYDECCIFAKALISLDISAYSTLNVIGFNSPQWAVAFSGSILGHYLPIGIYTTNAPDACQYIANHSQCQIVVLQDRVHLKKYIAVKDKVKNIKYFVMWKDQIPADLDKDFAGRVLTWDQFMTKGKNFKPLRKQDELQYRMKLAKPGNCATFIYTSGTTGPPKAVMISHDNYTWVADAIGANFKLDRPDRKGRMLSMLPLSHVAAQVVDLVLCIRFGFNVFFTDPSALQGNLVKFLLICKPTFFVCVPRVWEKIEERITAIASQTTGVKKSIAQWAKSKGPHGTYAQITGKGSKPLGWSIAKKLVFDKIKQNLGLDECQQFIFSAAPMRQSTRQFFLNLNIFLQNCYGMSELSGPQTFTDPMAWDTFDCKQFYKEAGKCMPGLELAIDNPDAEGNGQICLRGRNCFMGYFKNEEQTRKTIDGKGFVHSGDVGVLEKTGTLTITGRIKELLITAGGQNVAPVLIENVINTELPIFSHVVVIGDKRKYLTCLMSLKLKNPNELTDEVVDYLKARGCPAKTVQQARNCNALKKIITEGIKKSNQKAISKAQHIIKFAILPHEFSIDGGQLTPTLKLKRKVINEMYAAEIESLYVDPKL